MTNTKSNLFTLLIFSLFLLNEISGYDFPENQSGKNHRSKMDLSGYWRFDLDTGNVGIDQKWFNQELSDSIELPGTTDTNKKGFLNTDTTTGHLNRVYKYEGAAWYKKEIVIGDDWKDKHIQLVLERTKPSKIWIDNIFIGESILLESPQIFDISDYLTPGKHTITCRIDNSLKQTSYGNVHIYSDDTQTNWNGIIGKLYLEVSDRTFIKDIQVYPDIAGKKVKIKMTIDNQLALEKVNVDLNVSKEYGNKISELKPSHFVLQCDETIELEYTLGGQMELWDEYDQPLYHMKVIISGKEKNINDNKQVSFGMREFKTSGTNFTINGRTTFLRGKHDACVFPLTGHSPMDTTEWMRVLRIAKSYGINHYRFHSYCPPEAAFIAADRLGIYLQPELPFWGGLESDEVADNLLKEGLALLKAYGNHPSFVMFSPGNEIWSGHDRVEKMISTLKKYDNRFLYAQGSNNNIGYIAPKDYQDFHVAVRTPYSQDTTLTHVRLSHGYVDSRDGGIINTIKPSTDFNFDYPVSQIQIPFVSHEIGQYQIYPDYDEIKKYTGVLKPWNLEVFRKRLINAGMIEQNKEFQKASGALSVLCYKAEIEAALRTKGFAGFQLLDLQDFPGQGTALIGILDAFMDSKNVTTPQCWRQFCSEVVPLLQFEKYCWQNSETFNANISVANYSNKDLNQNLKWEAVDKDGKVIANGIINNVNIPLGGLYSTGKIEFPLSSIDVPAKVDIKLSLENTDYQNSYSIWIYPAQNKITPPNEITVTSTVNEKIMQELNSGAKVLFFPSKKLVKKNSVGGLFNPDFWNYGMFKGISEWAKKPVSPGTLGILTDPEHPVFKRFPTDFHTNWQWWSIIKNSNPLILNATKHDYKPIVQVIDNLERNNKMGLLFEFKVGKGKLLICMSDLRKIDKPEADQLYKSIIDYMMSDKFNPEYNADEKFLNTLLQ